MKNAARIDIERRLVKRSLMFTFVSSNQNPTGAANCHQPKSVRHVAVVWMFA